MWLHNVVGKWLKDVRSWLRGKPQPPIRRQRRRTRPWLEALEDRTTPSISVALTGAAPNLTVIFSNDATAPVDNHLVLRFNTAAPNNLEYSINGGAFSQDLDTAAAGVQTAQFSDIAAITTNFGLGSDNVEYNLQTFAFNAVLNP